MPASAVSRARVSMRPRHVCPCVPGTCVRVSWPPRQPGPGSAGCSVNHDAAVHCRPHTEPAPVLPPSLSPPAPGSPLSAVRRGRVPLRPLVWPGAAVPRQRVPEVTPDACTPMTTWQKGGTQGVDLQQPYSRQGLFLSWLSWLLPRALWVPGGAGGRPGAGGGQESPPTANPHLAPCSAP